ncbi:MAG: ABC transporter permease [Verrucomicrobiota bacterium]|jgi:hypothetical protein
MIESSPASLAPAVAARPLPGFFAALRGVWLLSWRAQLAWRRLPSRLGALLVLPALIYITTQSPESWARGRMSLGRPDSQLLSFYRRLDRASIPIQPPQKSALASIMLSEYRQAQRSWEDRPDESADARRQRLKQHIDACGDAILARAKTQLDDRQFAQFQTWEERNRADTLKRLSETPTGWGRTAPFYHWLVDFYLLIILPLACVRGCGPLVRDELQADTLGFLITRPVSRARLLIAMYLSQVAWLEILLLVELLLLFAAGAARGIPALGALLPLLMAVQFLSIPAWSALGLLLGQITTRYMATALIYGAVVEMGIGRIPTNINTLSLMRHIKTLLSQNATLQGIFDWQTGGTITALCALVLAPLIFLSVAALLFSFIEYHHAAEMQK